MALKRWREAVGNISDDDLLGADQELRNQVAIIDAMTPEEREDPTVFEKNAFKRKDRIAKESKTTIHDLNRLLDSFFLMQVTQQYMAELHRKGKPIPNSQNELLQLLQNEGIPKKMRQRMTAIQKKTKR